MGRTKPDICRGGRLQRSLRMTDKPKVVAIVGAGLVGSLEACYLAKRNTEVHVYEYRGDIRQMEHVPGRSINLAMSVRGLGALDGVGLGDHVKDEYGIPMHSRMIHNRDGSTNPIPYGKENQHIYSVGRRYVNEILLDAGSKYKNITFHFNHKLIKANLDKPELIFERTDVKDSSLKTVVVNPDLVIGCDGAFSATFENIKDRDSLLHFFNDNFRDSIPLIGIERLVSDYFSNRALPLVSVKCNPYHVANKSLIMGDAAHAMVPFYGQGMNCGMEDCLVLEDALENNNMDLSLALQQYSETRNPDAEAMCDLALYNYIEMRDLVNKKSFLIRKKLDNFLHWLLPTWWVPLYTSVTFSRMRYHKCVSNRAWQDSALGKISSLAGIFGLAASVWLVSFSWPSLKIDPKHYLSSLLTIPSLIEKEL